MARGFIYVTRIAIIVSFLTSFLAISPHARASVYWYPVNSPLYWSGTNCRASISVIALRDSGCFKRARFYIRNGSGQDPVYEANWGGPGMPPTFGITMMFDSTHFSYATPITVELQMTDQYNNVFSYSYSAPVKNCAVLYGLAEFEQSINPLLHGAAAGLEHLPDMNYDYREKRTAGWSFTNLIEDLQPSNIFYVNSHGGHTNDHPLDPDGLPSVNERYWFITSLKEGNDKEMTERVLGMPPLIGMSGYWWYALYGHISAKIGTGVPPHNSTGKPPVNLAFIDACWTGRNNEFAEGLLWPYVAHTTPGVCACGSYVENQSQVGYRIQFEGLNSYTCMNAYWECLKTGATVWEARNILYDEYIDFLNDPGSPEALQAIWGDFCTRVHAVYNFSFSGPIPGSWFYLL